MDLLDERAIGVGDEQAHRGLLRTSARTAAAGSSGAASFGMALAAVFEAHRQHEREPAAPQAAASARIPAPGGAIP